MCREQMLRLGRQDTGLHGASATRWPLQPHHFRILATCTSSSPSSYRCWRGRGSRATCHPQSCTNSEPHSTSTCHLRSPAQPRPSHVCSVPLPFMSCSGFCNSAFAMRPYCLPLDLLAMNSSINGLFVHFKTPQFYGSTWLSFCISPSFSSSPFFGTL